MSLSVPDRSPDSNRRGLRFAGYLAAALLLLLSLIARLPQLSAPLAGAHDFRQTQVAITVWTFITDRIEFARYKTPVFGEPWRAPFEFPLYQAVVAVLVRTTGLEIEPSSRIVSILFFYGTVGCLFWLVRHLTRSTACGMCAALIYAFQPLSIAWSRTCMIESCATFFTWLFLSAWVKSLDPLRLLESGNPARRVVWVVLAVAAGICAAIVKATTVAAIFPLVVLLTFAHLYAARAVGRLGRESAFALFPLIPPIIAGLAWMIYTDGVKAAGEATRWLTGPRMHRFNFGTFDQRLELWRWKFVGNRVAELACPGLLLALVFVGLIWAAHRRKSTAILAWGAAAGVLFPVLVFFNLYVVHEYYLAAVMPCLAVLGGLGLYFCLVHLRNIPARVLILVVLSLSLASAWPYVRISYGYDADLSRRRVGAMVASATMPHEHALIAGDDWNSSILYHARRRGLMFRSDVFTPYEAAAVRKVTCLVVRDNAAAPAIWYSRKRLLGQTNGYFVYKVEFVDFAKP